MNTDLDDPLARAVAAGRDRLLAMMQKPPQARPQPLTRKAYLAKLEPLVAEARGRGYGDAEIARALSLDAETVKALNLDLDALLITERGLRRGCGEAAKVVESASLKARKQPAPGSGGRGKPAVDPAAARTKAPPTGIEPTDAAPSVEQAPSGSATGRDTDATEPVEPTPEEPARAGEVASGRHMQDSARDAGPTSGSTAPQKLDLLPPDPVSTVSRHRAEIGGLAAFAKGHAQRIETGTAASGTAPGPSDELPF